jgi:hypothetical protein
MKDFTTVLSLCLWAVLAALQMQVKDAVVDDVLKFYLKFRAFEASAIFENIKGVLSEVKEGARYSNTWRDRFWDSVWLDCMQ